MSAGHTTTYENRDWVLVLVFIKFSVIHKKSVSFSVKRFSY